MATPIATLRGFTGLQAAAPETVAEKDRHPVAFDLVQRGFRPILALDDGVAAHFVKRKLAEIVTPRRRARAFFVAKEKGKVVERPLSTRYLGVGR